MVFIVVVFLLVLLVKRSRSSQQVGNTSKSKLAAVFAINRHGEYSCMKFYQVDFKYNILFILIFLSVIFCEFASRNS